MKRRIPFDIEFLLESLTNVPINSHEKKPTDDDPNELVNESPDSLVINKKQRDMFFARGYHAPEDLGKIAYYDRSDASAFVINIARKLTIYNPIGMGDVRLTHPDVGSMVMGYLAKPNDYDKFPVKNGKGFAFDLKQDIEPPPGPDIGAVAVLQANSVQELASSLRTIGKDMPLDGDIPRRDPKFIQGRVWVSSKAISFWVTKDIVTKNFNLIDELLIGLNLKKEEVIYEFTDSRHLYTYDELTGESVETRTKEEMDRLMAIQHLDPKAKKKLAAMQNNLKQKSAAGWDFMAQKNAAMPALQETPDRVIGNGINAHWKDGDAITFVFDVPEKRILWIDAAEVAILNPLYAGRPNHAALIRQVAYYRNYPKNFEIVSDKFGGWMLNTKDGAPSNQAWFYKEGVHGTGFSGKEDFDSYLALADWSKTVDRKLLPPEFILGRLWQEPKIISYWQPKSMALKQFPMTEKFVELFGMNPENISYEFIDIKKVFVYDELFQEDDEKYKRGSDEIADLLKRQHTDPSAKKRLKDLGYYDKVDKRPKGMGGFDFKAQKDAAMPALQEIIKKFNIAK